MQNSWRLADFIWLQHKRAKGTVTSALHLSEKSHTELKTQFNLNLPVSS